MKPVKLPKSLGVTAPRASPNQGPSVSVLNRTRINIKNDPTTRISELSSGKQIHGKTGNMRNIRNRKGGSRKSATTSNRKRSTISSKNTNRKRKRTKRRKRGRIRRHVKRSSRIQNPRRCT
jgi:hypothetical protein